MEDAGPRRRILLEGADLLIGLKAQFGRVVIGAHQLRPVIGADILALGGPAVEHLLAEVQRPVEAGRVVVDQLRIGNDFADAVDHARDRSEEHTSELQSLMRISYAVFCLKKKKKNTYINKTQQSHI